ncbi:MAG: hypothetical protein K0S51_2641 [Bacillales bacterium]|jgi:hypothetical protein|nr:hypothetical protein [Bacillales bacterium]
MNKLEEYFSELTPLYCIHNTQKNIYNLYCNSDLTINKTSTYAKSQSFINFLDQGKNYIKHSSLSDISIKPILSYYGLVQLIKACVLLVDPEYPENTSVLAHGLTSRKRKKQDFEFLSDEIKLQKNGLFVHCCKKMFHVEHFYEEKFSMLSLIVRIPELNTFFETTKGVKYLEKVLIKNDSIYINNTVLDELNITVDTFTGKFIENKIVSAKQFKDFFVIKGYYNDRTEINKFKPFHFNINNGSYYCINNRHISNYIPEILAHYIILYNLSMICRYETDWWMEMLKDNTSLEYNSIKLYLENCNDKICFLIKEYILDEIQKVK